jgi:hypothetical protein
MNQPNDKHQQLEKYIDSVLRAQPMKRAPAGLESNVLAAIRHRVSRPWWQQGFSAWPLAAKALFLVASVGFARAALVIATWGTSPLDSTSTTQLPQSFAWMHTVTAVISAALQLIPNFWVYAIVGLVTAMYVLLFGVSAAAYRTLYAPR